jgi:hypothetical protein
MTDLDTAPHRTVILSSILAVHAVLPRWGSGPAQDRMERNNLRRRIAMHLGIEHNTGLVYEADGGIYMPVSPIPVVTQATLIDHSQNPQAI